MTTAHIMAHTHWDREWFLLSDVTNEWLDDLFDRVFQVIEQQADYRYILDGQTLMLEDYLTARPEQLSRIQQYAKSGNLLIGPYYGQVDWRVVSEESLMRNLYLGMKDAQSYGNPMPHGWLMDNFGHCSQQPQIHKLFGIDEVFVWRGPVFENDAISSDFVWQGSDGSEVYANYLMSGYRNFYNITDTTDFLEMRDKQLRDMLAPFTPHGQFVYLNGYDLDVFPEDAFKFIEEGKEFVRSTPERYARTRDRLNEEAGFTPPTVQGELYSGKYACVFPGSLSARMYLRIENSLAENLLTFYLEPLQALLSKSGLDVDVDRSESLWRDLLKTQLHDNIGGVSIDQIHDNMECVYKHVYDSARELISTSLAQLPALFDLQNGTYAFMPSPFEYESLWLDGGDSRYRVSSKGMGVYQVEEERPAVKTSSPIDSFKQDNEFYSFEITGDRIRMNGNPVGELVLERDLGDSYNADPEAFAQAPEVKILSLRVREQDEEFVRLELYREIRQDDIQIHTTEEILLNNSPVLQWKLTATTEGKNYRLRFCYDTQDRSSDVFAKMPYDIYQRSRKDRDYFGQEIPDALKPVLLAAREIDAVADFPFQGFVALSDATRTRALFAKGLREYEVDESGKIFATLKRSIEWIAQPIRTRVGDAGPKMYVPSGKDERTTHFEMALIDCKADVRSETFLKWFYLFDYGWLLFENNAHDGFNTDVQLWNERLPWAGMQTLESGKTVMRVYNPYQQEYCFSESYVGSDPFGKERGDISSLAPNVIEHIEYAQEFGRTAPAASPVQLLNFPAWPVEEDRSTVDPEVVAWLKEEIQKLQGEKSEAEQKLSTLSPSDGKAYHVCKHSVIRLDREILELALSILLNEEKVQGKSEELTEKIKKLGKELNLSRRHRRTYDYILSLFDTSH